MLTLTINPGGKARVVTIAEALYLFGVDIHRPHAQAVERTPEEKRRHKAEMRREYQRRALEQQREQER